MFFLALIAFLHAQLQLAAAIKYTLAFDAQVPAHVIDAAIRELQPINVAHLAQEGSKIYDVAMLVDQPDELVDMWRAENMALLSKNSADPFDVHRLEFNANATGAIEAARKKFSPIDVRHDTTYVLPFIPGICVSDVGWNEVDLAEDYARTVLLARANPADLDRWNRVYMPTIDPVIECPLEAKDASKNYLNRVEPNIAEFWWIAFPAGISQSVFNKALEELGSVKLYVEDRVVPGFLTFQTRDVMARWRTKYLPQIWDEPTFSAHPDDEEYLPYLKQAYHICFCRGTPYSIMETAVRDLDPESYSDIDRKKS